MHFVYILLSLKDWKFYIGYTTDLDERIKKHNQGGVKSTSTRLPMKLIFYEAYLNKYDALRRERYFKSTPGRKTLKIMLRETLFEIKNNINS
ncbi:MAG: GIY-YIG nuclease family protein [Parcubacteria group bacterium]